MPRWLCIRSSQSVSHAVQSAPHKNSVLTPWHFSVLLLKLLPYYVSCHTSLLSPNSVRLWFSDSFLHLEFYLGRSTWQWALFLQLHCSASLLRAGFRVSHPLASSHHDSIFCIIQPSRWATLSWFKPSPHFPLKFSRKASQDLLLNFRDELPMAYIILPLECLPGILNWKPHLDPISHLPTHRSIPSSKWLLTPEIRETFLGLSFPSPHTKACLVNSASKTQ